MRLADALLERILLSGSLQNIADFTAQLKQAVFLSFLRINLAQNHS